MWGDNMRTGNIRIRFEIPCHCDEPDLNGNIYTRDAIEKAYKGVKDIPIGIHNDNGDFIPIGIAQEIEIIENHNDIFIKGIGLIFHGGTNESVEITDGRVTKMDITAVGIAKE